MAVVSVMLPCGMEATLWMVAPDVRCDALGCSKPSVAGSEGCDTLRYSWTDEVDTADGAVCPCVGPVPEATVPAEVETGCATMTEAECDGAICSCARTVPDGGGMAEADEAMMHETDAANLIV